VPHHRRNSKAPHCWCESQPRACSDLGPHNTVTTKETVFKTEEMHAASFTLGATSGFTVKLSHTSIGRYTLGQGQAMVAISSNERIVLLRCGHASGGNGFLAHIGMEKSADLARHFIHFFRFQFKLADQLHQFIPVQVGFFGEFSSHYTKF